MVYFLGFCGLVIGLLFPAQSLIASIIAVLFLKKNYYLLRFRFAILLLFLGSVRSLLLNNPLIGDVCYGYVKGRGNGYEVVSVSHCKTWLGHKFDLYTNSDSSIRLSMYTSVTVLITKIGTNGSRFQGRVLSIQQEPGALMRWYATVMSYGILIKERFYSAVSAVSSPEVASFAVSILYGETHIQEESRKMMRDLGVVHIMAVSGVNILYLMSFLAFLGKKVGRKFNETLSFLALLFLFVLVGESVSLIRAILMFVLDFLIKKIGIRIVRERFYVTLLLMAFISPTLLGNYSYLLVTAACFAVYQVVGDLRERIVAFKDGIAAEVLSSLTIWGVIVPVQWILFRDVSWIGAIVGIVAAPFVEVATVVGYLTSVFYFFHINLLPLYLTVVSLLLLVLKMFHGN